MKGRPSAGFLLYLYFHQTVFVAVNVNIPSASQTESGFGVALGVKLHKLHGIGGQIRHKRNKVGFGHFVIDGYEMLILNLFNADLVSIIGVFRFKSRQSDSAAAYECIAARPHYVAANGANVKF